SHVELKTTTISVEDLRLAFPCHSLACICGGDQVVTLCQILKRMRDGKSQSSNRYGPCLPGTAPRFKGRFSRTWSQCGSPYMLSSTRGNPQSSFAKKRSRC